MAIYLVSGKLGSGKTLASVGRIRDALLAGRRVATNLNLRMEHLLPVHAGRPRFSDVACAVHRPLIGQQPDMEHLLPLYSGRPLLLDRSQPSNAERLLPVPVERSRFVHQPISCIRLPDKPSLDDLYAIGCGNESMNEEKNGLIVLDELAAWLNARQWADKGRQEVIDWLIHSRKHGWDVMFIAQHLDQIDKQVRSALVEFLVVCRRLDRMKVPFVGGFLNTITGGMVKGTMPKMHLGIVRYGTAPDAPKADTWMYKGTDLYNAYDTRQIFKDEPSDVDAHRCKFPPIGVLSYLPPWHLIGWKHQPPKTFMDRLVLALQGHKPPKPLPKPKHRLVRLLERLPEHQRIYHFQRLDALGAFAAP